MALKIKESEEKALQRNTDGDILESWIQGQLSQATRKAYTRELQLFLEWIYPDFQTDTDFNGIQTIKTVTVKSIVTYRNFLSESKAPSTVARSLSALKSLFKYLVALQILPQSPADFVKLPKVSQESNCIALEQRDIERLINAVENVKDPFIQARDRLILLLMFQNGLRRAEVTQIQLCDFDKIGEYNILRVHAKGGGIDTTKIKPIVKICLESYVQAAQQKGILIKDDDYLFASASNNGQKTSEHGGISTTAIYHLIKKYARLADLPNDVVQRLHPHCARHSAITIVTDKMGIHKAVAFARHQDPKTTYRYYRKKADLSVHGTDVINLEINYGRVANG